MSILVQVLLVEDDDAVRDVVAFHLSRGGFQVIEASNALDGWQRIEEADAIVLDRMLPDESGDSFLKRLRADPLLHEIPVLMLTARATEVDRVEGLESGADDYVTKPFSSAELVARVKALLRRVPRQQRVDHGDLTVDVEMARVVKAGEEVPLARREFALLAFLVAHPGRVFSRSELLDRVWGVDYVGSDRTVDQHVAQLRSRFGSPVIKTVRGRGYRIGTAEQSQ